jgi:hypothetical protein
MKLSPEAHYAIALYINRQASRDYRSAEYGQRLPAWRAYRAAKLNLLRAEMEATND